MVDQLGNPEAPLLSGSTMMLLLMQRFPVFVIR
jgi:hypothetical protein